jgi:hypothetical protein
MSFGYRNEDKAYRDLIIKMTEAKSFDNDNSQNRYKVLEGKEPKEYKNILAPEDAKTLLKSLKVEFDNEECYGGGVVYTLKGNIVAEYNPGFMNIAVYQDLEDTLPKPEVKIDAGKPDHVTDTNINTSNEKKTNEDFGSYAPTTSPTTSSTANTKPYVPLARGVSNKNVADELAKEQGGVVSNDDKETNKFMVVKAGENVVDDADKVQGGKDVMDSKTMPSATDLKIPSLSESETIDSLEAKIADAKTKIGSLKGKEKSDAEKNLKGDEAHLRYLRSQPKNEAVSESTKAYCAHCKKETALMTNDEGKHKSKFICQGCGCPVKHPDSRIENSKESQTNEGPNGGSEFQQEGKWSDSLTEDCIIKRGDQYRFADGQEIEVISIVGNVVNVKTNDGDEVMHKEEIDHLIHGGQLKKIGQNTFGYQEESFTRETANAIAEKYFLARALLQRAPGTLSEKQKKFIKENIKPKLEAWQATEVTRILAEKFGEVKK